MPAFTKHQLEYARDAVENLRNREFNEAENTDDETEAESHIRVGHALESIFTTIDEFCTELDNGGLTIISNDEFSDFDKTYAADRLFMLSEALLNGMPTGYVSKTNSEYPGVTETLHIIGTVGEFDPKAFQSQVPDEPLKTDPRSN